MKDHHRQVIHSIFDSIFHQWKHSEYDLTNSIINAFELQDQCEFDDIDFEHYLESAGDA